MADATLKGVADWFGKVAEEGGYPQLSNFSKDWKELSEKDRTDLKRGIGDGTLTY